MWKIRLSIKLITLFGLFLCVVNTAEAQSPKEITNSLGMRLVLIPNGTFKMGAPSSEKGVESDEIEHEVIIGREFYIGAFEVSQSQFTKVMGFNPSLFQGERIAERDPESGRVLKNLDSLNRPVERVSWEEAVEFCRRLSEFPEEKREGRVYRLPTEAEWEYACRAGSQTAFNFGESSLTLGNYSWFRWNSNDQTHPVGKKKPNAWGLFDMHGNVWEWCSDWYGEYPKETTIDPRGPPKGLFRVFRGGSWCSEDVECRSALRYGCNPANRYDDVGFRLAVSVPGGDR